jgi:hypothetical protein|uniref:HMG box domain-containing protein n=1 Tax=viral metagenome TaxID=1070528 RepID=A0A6C0CDQ1_9ZZZZ
MSSTTINQRVELLEKQVALLLKAGVPVEAVPDAKEKPAKKAKVAKKEVIAEEEKPKKKRTSGYLLYSADTREAVKTKLTTDGAKLKNQDIMTELGAMWKALSEEDRTKWNDKAKGSDDETELSE